jgi:hypothetical protein
MLLGVGSIQAQQDDAIRSRLMTAREKYANLEILRTIYYEKKNRVSEINQLNDRKRDLNATIGHDKVALGGYPGPRMRNNFQNAEINALNAEIRACESEVITANQRIGVLSAQIREIDESVLTRAELTGRAPGPANRRDILVIFPGMVKDCEERFDDLQAVLDPSAVDFAAAERKIRDMNTELNRIGEGDSKYGPINPFIAQYKKLYVRQRPAAKNAKNAKAKGRN